MADNWLDKVIKLVSSVPKGRVVSYGQVAAALGSPRASRAVGWTLSRLPYGTKVPWQRVVNRKGELSIVHPHVRAQDQADLLEKDGVIVEKINDLYVVDIKKYKHNF